MLLNLENMDQWYLIRNCTEDFESYCREYGSSELANKVFFLNQKIAGYAVPWKMPYFWWEVIIMTEALNLFWEKYDMPFIQVAELRLRLGKEAREEELG